MNIMPEDGDKILTTCSCCGTEYSIIVGVSNDRSLSYCPTCYIIHEELREHELMAGTWRINNKEVRDKMVLILREYTPYIVHVDERIGDIYLYSRGLKQ
jgi:hypothetical protein